MNILDYLKNLFKRANEVGIYIPVLQDPKTKKPSVSMTMMVISFNLCLIAMIGKWSKAFDGIDPSQATNLFMICSALYFGRKISKNSDGSVTEDEKKNIDSSK